MEIAIISDSHYSVEKVAKLFNHLQDRGVHHLIHAGDFIGQNIEKVFAGFPDIKSWVARGNCDGQYDVLDKMSSLEHVTVDDVLRFEIESFSFLVTHIPGTLLSMLNKKTADVAIHGHTHQARVENYNSVLLLNPGSLMDGDGFMILELPSLKVERFFNF